MANVKKVRKKHGRLTKVIGVLVFLLIVGFYLWEEIPQWVGENEPLGNQSETTQESQNQGVQVQEGELILTMIDVGQADGFYLEQNGKTAVIDCGTVSTGKDMVDYLKAQGVTRLDYVIGTHPHEDHMGGMYDIITNFEVGTIVIPKVTKNDITSKWYAKLMKEIKDAKHTVDYPEVGEIYTLGDSKMEVLGPKEEPKSNLNNYSIVMKITFGTMDIIMTGDAERDIEAEIIASGADLDAEILKLGHHGSDTSSSKEFLDVVDPDYALISTKVGNKYEHPTKSVMEDLDNLDIEVYRTDECGTVVLTITDNDVEFSTKPGDYLSGIELEERSTK